MNLTSLPASKVNATNPSRTKPHLGAYQPIHPPRTPEISSPNTTNIHTAQRRSESDDAHSIPHLSRQSHYFFTTSYLHFPPTHNHNHHTSPSILPLKKCPRPPPNPNQQPTPPPSHLKKCPPPRPPPPNPNQPPPPQPPSAPSSTPSS